METQGTAWLGVLTLLLAVVLLVVLSSCQVPLSSRLPLFLVLLPAAPAMLRHGLG